MTPYAQMVEVATQAGIYADFNKWWSENSFQYFGPNATDQDKNIALILFCVGAEWGMEKAAGLARASMLRS